MLVGRMEQETEWICWYCDRLIEQDEREWYHSVEYPEGAKAHRACCEREGFCAEFFEEDRPDE